MKGCGHLTAEVCTCCRDLVEAVTLLEQPRDGMALFRLFRSDEDERATRQFVARVRKEHAELFGAGGTCDA